MVRTRRQAASQRKRSTNPQPADSGSDSDNDIPATRTRSRADPYKIAATLRPSKDVRPKVLLEPKKRGAAPARLASESPSNVKKRPRETVSTSITEKRRKTLPAEAVNPLAMEVMNQFGKKARGASQGTRAPRMRRFTVELERSSVRGTDQRTASETRMGRQGRVQPQHGEHGGEQSGEEPEEQPEEELAEEMEPESLPNHRGRTHSAMEEVHRGVGSPELDVASQMTPEPHVKRDHAQHTQPEPTGEGGRQTDGLPSRSGQGDAAQVGLQEGAPSLQTTRKSNRRVPKQAFDERPTVQEDVRSVSKSASAAPRPAEQPQAASTKPMSETEHLQKLFENDAGSPRKRAAQESIFVSDDSSEEEEASDGGEQLLSHDGEAQESIPHVTLSTTEVETTVQVPSKEVRSMCDLMGKKGWTARGRSWASELSHPRTLQSEGLPNTQFGQKVCKLVAVMRKDYRTAPQVYNAATQKSFLREKAERTEKAIAEISQHIDKTYDRYYKAIEGGGNRNVVALKDVLRGDVIQCVIPLLVLLLRDFFFLGGSSVDKNGDRALPEKEGEFTATTLQLLKRTTSWIVRLAAIIKRETELSAFEPTSDEEEEQVKSPARRKPDTVRRMRQERAKQRIDFEEHARQLSRALSKASDGLDEVANREARRRAMVERAVERKAQKEREEKEGQETKRRRLAAMCASMQRLRDDIGPVSSMWVRAQQLEESRARQDTAASVRMSVRPADGQRGPAGREQTHSPDLGGFFDEAQVYHPEPQVYHHEPTPASSKVGYAAVIEEPVQTSRPWAIVESQWLLRKLKEGGQPDYDSWAEALGRRVDEVRQEVHLLKLSTRSLAEEAGKKPPLWARR